MLSSGACPSFCGLFPECVFCRVSRHWPSSEVFPLFGRRPHEKAKKVGNTSEECHHRRETLQKKAETNRMLGPFPWTPPFLDRPVGPQQASVSHCGLLQTVLYLILSHTDDFVWPLLTASCRRRSTEQADSLMRIRDSATRFDFNPQLWHSELSARLCFSRSPPCVLLSFSDLQKRLLILAERHPVSSF